MRPLLEPCHAGSLGAVRRDPHHRARRGGGEGARRRAPRGQRPRHPRGRIRRAHGRGARAMTAPTFIVFAKELRDSLRDRRTALMVILASIIMGPLTLVLGAQFVSGLEEKSKTLKARLSGREHAPALVTFLQRNDVAIEAAPAAYEENVREA